MAINLANNNSLANITALPSSISGGAMTLIQTQTASSSSAISFTSGIDSTYDEYVFKFIDISNGSNATFQFNVSIDGGSNYNVAKTTTRFRAEINEDNASDNGLSYLTGEDLAQGTGGQIIASVRSDADSCCVGTLHLFNPSSTTFVKNFISRLHSSNGSYCEDHYNAGYANTTSAINGIKFFMSAGSINSGVIKLYGIS